MNQYMVKKQDNPCVRCGRDRILSKVWKKKEKSFTGKIYIVRYEQTICPDKECQKIVEEGILSDEAKRAGIRLKKQENDDARKQNSLNNANIAKKNKVKNKSRI